MAVKKINWNLKENYTFKHVDLISLLNKKMQTTHSAWGTESELISPTTAFWLNYKLTTSDRAYTTSSDDLPYYKANYLLSSSFNKTIFPSKNPENFLVQDLNSVVYYLDVYSSKKIPIELNPSDHLYFSHSVYADSPNLIFSSNISSTGYSTIALLPNEKVFSLAWGDISGSGAISSSYLPVTLNTQPSKAVYYTYKSITNQTGSFISVGTGSVERFFAIHLNKEKLKNGIVPGTIELPLMISASYSFFTSSNYYTNDIITIADYTQSLLIDQELGPYSYLVSGTLENKNIDSVYGTVYYDLGILLLDSDKLDLNVNLDINKREYPTIFTPSTPSEYREYHLNSVKLFNSIQACSYRNLYGTPEDLFMNVDSGFSPVYFKCKVKENTVENPVYIVIKANEFNYSNNPSWQQNELLNPSEIVSGSIPSSCKSFTDLGYGCNELQALQQKYVYWYYPTKESPDTIFAAYFIKNETGDCNCEYLGNLYEYKKLNRLPHLNYKSNTVKKDFLNNPITYITTIGLYDDVNRLLAVGKLSKPLKKDQFTAYMLKINLKI
jgi:hypothetical protein